MTRRDSILREIGLAPLGRPPNKPGAKVGAPGGAANGRWSRT